MNQSLTDWLAKLQPEEAAILEMEQNEEFENCKYYKGYQARQKISKPDIIEQAHKERKNG